MKKMTRTFGVRQIGIFFEKLRLEDHCFYYKGKEYKWSDVVAIKRSDDLINMLSRFPSSTILLNDGNIIRLPIILSESGKTTVTGIISGESGESYKECLAIFTKKSKDTREKYNKYLRPYSYIMFYRLGMIVPGIQCLSFGIIMYANHSMDSFLVFLFILAACFFVMSFIMMFNRHFDERTVRKMLSEKNDMCPVTF